jgi:hypothetical protein
MKSYDIVSGFIDRKLDTQSLEKINRVTSTAFIYSSCSFIQRYIPFTVNARLAV